LDIWASSKFVFLISGLTGTTRRFPNHITSLYMCAKHMFGNHLYMCADWWHCYIQRLGLDEHPLDKSLLADVRERIVRPHGTGDHS
jgi:hypothetical protein